MLNLHHLLSLEKLCQMGPIMIEIDKFPMCHNSEKKPIPTVKPKLDFVEELLLSIECLNPIS